VRSAATRYELTSTWRLDAPVGVVWDVFDAMVDDDDPFPWWPDLEVVGRDDDEIRVVTRSGLGYRLRLRLLALEQEPPVALRFRAAGDLVGFGHVQFVAESDATSRMDIAWTVEPTQRWMRRSGVVLKPVFAIAHAVVMRRGERSLRSWLATH
jgi:hypothetical protein